MFSLRFLDGGEIRGRVGLWKATFVVDLEQRADPSIEVIIDAGSLETGAANATATPKQRVSSTSPASRNAISQHQIFPDEGDRRLTLTGDLTIRDVTREIRIVVEHEGVESLQEPGSKLAFKGHVSVQRLEFGLRWQQELERSGLVAGGVVDVDLRVNARRGAT